MSHTDSDFLGGKNGLRAFSLALVLFLMGCSLAKKDQSSNSTAALSCASPSYYASQGSVKRVTWVASGGLKITNLVFDIDVYSDPKLYFLNLGNVAASTDDPLTAVYTGPNSLINPVTFNLRAKDIATGTIGTCKIRLVGSNESAVLVDANDPGPFPGPTMLAFTGGPVGGDSVQFLNFNASPAYKFFVLAINFDGTQPVGGQSDLTSNFYLKIDGNLKVSNPGSYTLQLASDDGSTMSLDGAGIILNDGSHGVAVVNKTLTLGAGLHPFEILFYQGGGGFALQLNWQPPGSSTFVPIPANALMP